MENPERLEKLTEELRESLNNAQSYHNALDELHPKIQSLTEGKDIEPWIPTKQKIREIQRLENLCKQEQERQRNILNMMYRLKKYRSE